MPPINKLEAQLAKVDLAEAKNDRKAKRLRPFVDEPIAPDPIKPLLDRDVVEHLLDKLTPEDRRILVLRYLERMTRIEIAAATDAKPNLVSKRIRKALNEAQK